MLVTIAYNRQGHQSIIQALSTIKMKDHKEKMIKVTNKTIKLTDLSTIKPQSMISKQLSRQSSSIHNSKISIPICNNRIKILIMTTMTIVKVIKVQNAL